MKPLLKWAGGKRALLPEILKRIPKFERYHESFIGGGALLFELTPRNVMIGDVNPDLVQFYRKVRDEPKRLYSELQSMELSKESYLQVRIEFNDPYTEPVRKAAAFLFLNKTCYNGLFRVNSKGQFNVPYGNKKRLSIPSLDHVLIVSSYLRQVNEILCRDFKSSIPESIYEGDFFYFDPPYVPIGKNGFTEYSKEGFGVRDQYELMALCKYIDWKGAKFMLSNSDTPFTRELYKDFTIDIVKNGRSISCKSDGRKEVTELLVRNYNV